MDHNAAENPVMARIAKEGASLAAVTKMAVPLLREAERQCPRRGRGDRPKIPDWFIGALIMIATLRRQKSKSAQYRFIWNAANQAMVSAATGQTRFPRRSAFFARYRRAHLLLGKAIELQGRRAVAEKVTDATHVAVDKSLVAARGPAWHRQERQVGRAPAGVDREAAWGRSAHRGWRYGYSFETVVSATNGAVVFPLLASADTGSVAETKTFAAKIPCLPPEVRTVAADSGYDANALGERVEYDAQGRRTGRRYLCPENPRHHGRTKTKPGGADAARRRGRERRAARLRHLKSPAGKHHYRRRKKTVEPFNSWFKALFEFDQRAWHRGLDNNRTQLLAAMFVYQLLVRYNHRHGQPKGRLKALLETL